jgi:8-oxo-dGTP pyrophosphatase MutT (NUDIX family)
MAEGGTGTGQRARDARRSKPRRQYAALPFRLVADGRIEVLILTSRETGRWIVPKGWAKKGQAGHAVARREAREEAGLIGRVHKRPFGRYRYTKRLAGTETALCIVDVYALEVERQLDAWPEKGERATCWLSPDEAVDRVDDPGLGNLLRRAALLLHRRPLQR